VVAALLVIAADQRTLDHTPGVRSHGKWLFGLLRPSGPPDEQIDALLPRRAGTIFHQRRRALRVHRQLDHDRGGALCGVVRLWQRLYDHVPHQGRSDWSMELLVPMPGAMPQKLVHARRPPGQGTCLRADGAPQPLNTGGSATTSSCTSTASSSGQQPGHVLVQLEGERRAG
jgi:hypothetical protein